MPCGARSSPITSTSTTSSSPTLPEVDTDLILAERARTQARIAALRRTFDDIVASTSDDPPDDEHDPEGATIAFERQQIATFITDAERHVAALDEALARIQAGSYGTCEGCGQPIGAARLEARPTARLCVSCAAGSRSA